MQAPNWIVRTLPIKDAALRIFCVPYLGGSAMMFRSWQHEFPETVEVCPVELPGHGRRIRELPYSRVEPLVIALADAAESLLDRQFVLFGHSFGALICFEFARELRRRQLTMPGHLIVSASKAPQHVNDGSDIHTLPDQGVLNEIQSLGGTPSGLLENDELVKSIMPALRADFEALETYQYTSESPFDFPILALGGVMDSRVEGPALEAWAQHTRAGFTMKILPGGHFFIHEMQSQVLQMITATVDHTLSMRSVN